MIIAYDLGTGGVKASLVNEDCSIRKSTFRSYPTFCSPDGKREQRPLDWWNAIKDATSELVADGKASEINAICLSGHSMGIASIGRDGELLCDTMPIWVRRAGGIGTAGNGQPDRPDHHHSQISFRKGIL